MNDYDYRLQLARSGAGGWRATCAFAGRSRRWDSPTTVRLVSFTTMKGAPHLALQPFGQIPTYEDGGLALFETGAIRAAYRRGARWPAARRTPMPGRGRSRGCSRRSARWSRRSSSCGWPRYPGARAGRGLAQRLADGGGRRFARGWTQLVARLGDAEWLDGAFSAGDMMMVTVLRRLESSVGDPR